MSPLAVRPSSSALARPKSVIQTTPVGVEQQVRRLDVAVNDAARVGIRQALCRLAADLRHAAEERPTMAVDSTDETAVPPGSTAELEASAADGIAPGAAHARD